MAKQDKEKPITIIIGKILNILLVIVSILIIIGVYYIVQIKVFQNEYSNLFGYTFFEVATGSMSNTIEIGDVVVVKITKEVNKNEIIVYRDGDNFVTHRLIEKDGDKLVAKGDANNSEDKPIEEKMIIGEVVKIIPQLGTWQQILSSPEILVLIIILILILSVIYAYTSKSEEKNDK